jgi:hypothetical protein
LDDFARNYEPPSKGKLFAFGLAAHLAIAAIMFRGVYLTYDVFTQSTKWAKRAYDVWLWHGDFGHPKIEKHPAIDTVRRATRNVLEGLFATDVAKNYVFPGLRTFKPITSGVRRHWEAAKRKLVPTKRQFEEQGYTLTTGQLVRVSVAAVATTSAGLVGSYLFATKVGTPFVNAHASAISNVANDSNSYVSSKGYSVTGNATSAFNGHNIVQDLKSGWMLKAVGITGGLAGSNNMRLLWALHKSKVACRANDLQRPLRRLSSPFVKIAIQQEYQRRQALTRSLA